jgi:hypothetical protein
MVHRPKAAALRSIWPHFDAERSIKAPEYVRSLERNPVSISLPEDSSHWDAVHAIAGHANCPLPVKHVSDVLKEHRAIRGRSCFGDVGDQIEKILNNYPTLRWWMESEGLVIDKPKVDLAPLLPFDRFAGALVHSSWTNGRLPKGSLMAIAQQLDTEKFKLRDCLQPAQWVPISKCNQKYASKAIQTFEAAARHHIFVRQIRRRLYLARDRYRRAHRPKAPIETAY